MVCHLNSLAVSAFVLWLLKLHGAIQWVCSQTFVQLITCNDALQHTTLPASRTPLHTPNHVPTWHTLARLDIVVR